MKITVQVECTSQDELARVFAALADAQAPRTVGAGPRDNDSFAVNDTRHHVVHVGDPPGSTSGASTVRPKDDGASAGQSPIDAATDAATAGSQGATVTTSQTGTSTPTTGTSTDATIPAHYAKAKNLRKVVTAILEKHPDWKKEDVLRECEMARANGHPVLEAIAEEDLADRVEDACMSVWEKG